MLIWLAAEVPALLVFHVVMKLPELSITGDGELPEPELEFELLLFLLKITFEHEKVAKHRVMANQVV